MGPGLSTLRAGRLMCSDTFDAVQMYIFDIILIKNHSFTGCGGYSSQKLAGHTAPNFKAYPNFEGFLANKRIPIKRNFDKKYPKLGVI